MSSGWADVVLAYRTLSSPLEHGRFTSGPIPLRRDGFWSDSPEAFLFPGRGAASENSQPLAAHAALTVSTAGIFASTRAGLRNLIINSLLAI
jgi:hypothetical protein